MRHPAAALFLALASCAAMDQHIRETMCNPDAAFQEGMNDGRASRNMNQGFTDVCDPSVQPAVRAAYRDGYQAGLASRAAERPAVVVVDGGRRAWGCEARAFGDVFNGTGATEAEAAAAARASCTERHGEMFCREVACTRGR